MILINIILALSLQKIGAVKHTLMWADIDTTNDSIMWYAVGYGNNEYDIYHNGKRVRYIGRVVEGSYKADITKYRIYPDNRLVFVIAAIDTFDTTFIKSKIYYVNNHGEIYNTDDLSDIINKIGIRTGYTYPSGEDWEDTTRVDTIVEGQCIGSRVFSIIDTEYVGVDFTFVGKELHTGREEEFTESWYVDLSRREVLEKKHYPYLYGEATSEGSFWVSARHDSVFVSKIYPSPQFLYGNELYNHDKNIWDINISQDTQYFIVLAGRSTYVYNLRTGSLVKLLTPDSLPSVHYSWKRNEVFGELFYDYMIVSGPITGGNNGSGTGTSAVFLYRLQPFKLLTRAEYPGYDIGAASCDKKGRLYIGMRDTLKGDTVKIFVIDTLNNIVGQYQFPTNIPNDRDGVGAYLNGKYLYVEVPDFLADSTYIFKVEE